VCLGLHSPVYQCADCGTPRACSVSYLYSWVRLRSEICFFYREYVKADCPADIAVERVAKECQCAPRTVRRAIEPHKGDVALSGP